jgi:protein CpxP
MKKLLYTVALVVMGITASQAQQPGKERKEGAEKKERIERKEGGEKLTSEQRAEKAALAMQQKLSLTDDQKQKVQQIELDRIKKNEEWRKLDENAMKGKMEERKAFMKSSKEKMEQVLTEEQRKTLASSRDEMRDKMKDRRGKRPGRPDDKTPPPPPPAATNN